MSADFPTQSNPAQRVALQISSVRDAVDSSTGPIIVCWCFSDDACDD